MLKCLKQFKNNYFLGRIILDGKENRTLTKWTYGEAYKLAENVGNYILNHKLSWKEGGMELVGIFAKNRYEWMLTDMACCLFGLTLVPLYLTLGMDNLSYCLEHSAITTCFCS